MSNNSRRLSGDALAQALRDSRAVTLSRVDDLRDGQWRVPQRPGVNPVAWELAHLAWFAEFWILRGPHRVGADGFVHANRPPHIAGPDDLLDSSRLAHEARWSTALPSRLQVRVMLDEQLEACIAAIPDGDDDAQLYFHRLALFHEDMHGEAFAWLRAALEYAAPAGLVLPRVEAPQRLPVAGGEVALGGADPRGGFAFDNELPGRRVRLAGFEIDSAPVTAGRFLRFVEAGGYDDPAWWPGVAGAWRASGGPAHPARWRRAAGGWQVRWFDRWLPLDPQQPAIHVNAWEAEAYCRWAQCRLPSAAEWEHAARSTAMQWGACVWEWTADVFEPHPGFRAGPYLDYSAPWFGDHRELRGGAFATHPRLLDAGYRNFFEPHRTDVFAGFRTVSAHH
jgi:gamma-glutamyl hercynylcysteine S-oxide synthase